MCSLEFRWSNYQFLNWHWFQRFCLKVIQCCQPIGWSKEKLTCVTHSTLLMAAAQHYSALKTLMSEWEGWGGGGQVYVNVFFSLRSNLIQPSFLSWKYQMVLIWYTSITLFYSNLPKFVRTCTHTNTHTYIYALNPYVQSYSDLKCTKFIIKMGDIYKTPI